MCFSPEAAFTSAIVIGLIGVYGLFNVTKTGQLPLALLPFLFAFHQTLEGILWLYLRDHAVSFSTALTAQQGYVFLAYLFFPVYCPYIALNWETSSSRRIWIALILLVGLCVAFSHVDRIGWDTIMAVQVGLSSIQYPLIGPETGIPYLIAVVLPFLLCHDRKMWVLGILILLSCGVSFYAYYTAAASVWCFFAAWVSILSAWILYQEKHKE